MLMVDTCVCRAEARELNWGDVDIKSGLSTGQERKRRKSAFGGYRD